METSRFDASERLDTPERRVAYLNAAFETGDAEEIRDALGIVARARGMADIARDARLGRTSLYKAFGGNGNPEFGTVVRVLASLGIRLTAVAAGQPRRSRGRSARKGRARKRLEPASARSLIKPLPAGHTDRRASR